MTVRNQCCSFRTLLKSNHSRAGDMPAQKWFFCLRIWLKDEPIQSPMYHGPESMLFFKNSIQNELTLSWRSDCSEAMPFFPRSVDNKQLLIRGHDCRESMLFFTHSIANWLFYALGMIVQNWVLSLRLTPVRLWAGGTTYPNQFFAKVCSETQLTHTCVCGAYWCVVCKACKTCLYHTSAPISNMIYCNVLIGKQSIVWESSTFPVGATSYVCSSCRTQKQQMRYCSF